MLAAPTRIESGRFGVLRPPPAVAQSWHPGAGPADKRLQVFVIKDKIEKIQKSSKGARQRQNLSLCSGSSAPITDRRRAPGLREALDGSIVLVHKEPTQFSFRVSRVATPYKEATSGAFCGPLGPAGFVHRCKPRRDAQAVVRHVTCLT